MMAKITRENGEIEEVKVRTWDFVFRLWPVLVVLFTCVFWFGGIVSLRMETPNQKTVRILRHTTPLQVKLERIEAKFDGHKDTVGHFVMIERVDQLILEIKHLNSLIDHLEEELRKK